MALDFPDSPTLGQQFVANNATWVWDGVKWTAAGGGVTYAPINSPVFTGDPQTPLAPVGDNDSSVANTQFVTRSTANINAAGNVGRNLIHNPYFAVQQRGAGPWTANQVYTADRWQAVASAGGSRSITLPAITPANIAAIGDESAQYAWQNVFTGDAAAGGYEIITQPMENVKRTAGKTLIISFWGWVAVASLKVSVEMQQYFGTGGSPSPLVYINAGLVQLTTTPTRYSVTTVMPSVAGKVFGTNANTDTQQLNLWLSNGTSYASRSGAGVQSGTIAIWGVQVEIAQPGQTLPTPLEKIEYGDDLRHCHRFYQSWPHTLVSGSAHTASVNIFPTITFATPMRAAPTMAFANAAYTNASTLAWGNFSNSYGGYFSLLSSAAGAVYCWADITFTADL